MLVPMMEDISECDDVLGWVILLSEWALVLNNSANSRAPNFFAIVPFQRVLLVKLGGEGSADIAFILFAY